MKYNPRYIAYAKSNGFEPKEMFRIDKNLYPGGSMCGFILWISKMRREFKKTSPQSFLDDTLIDQNKFTKWMEKIT